MSRILIVYGTTEGHTAKIAERIADVLAAKGHSVETLLGEDIPNHLALTDFDGVVVGGSVHTGRHQRYIRKFVMRHREALMEKCSAFFSVSGTAADARPAYSSQAERILEQFLRQTQWRPDATATFAGAIPYTRYGPVTRWIMKRIVGSAGGDTDTSRDYEYTDWAAVERFADTVARLCDT